MIGWSIQCAVYCALLLGFERIGGRAYARGACKLLASTCFVAVGILASRGDARSAWTIAGLVLGAVGDMALVAPGKPAFAIGLGVFLLGHLAYIAAIAQVAPPHAWLGPLAAVPAAAGAAALAYLWPHLGKLRGPVIAYVAAIVAMTAGALAARDNARLAAGAVLFFVSDLSVARDRFVARSFANKAWGLPAYYAGQLLIAWSLAA
jgi:uncharacterized membrane protein YhhN